MGLNDTDTLLVLVGVKLELGVAVMEGELVIDKVFVGVRDMEGVIERLCDGVVDTEDVREDVPVTDIEGVTEMLDVGVSEGVCVGVRVMDGV